jgi:outer membrane protein assembly factor BamB
MKSLTIALCLYSAFACLAKGELPKSALPPPLPVSVASFGASATPEGTVFIYGGHAGVRHRYNREEVSGELHAWKPGETKWSSLGKDEPAQGASLLALRDKILRIGGMAARNSKGEPQDLWSSNTASAYDLKTNSWTALPRLPQRRSSHDSTLIGDTLYVLGGWALSGGGIHASEPSWHDTYLTLDLSKPDCQWQVHKQPFKRRAIAAQAIGTKLYVIGGMDDNGKPVHHVSILDSVTGEWVDGPALPSDELGGFGLSAVAHEGRLFANGVAGDLLELRGGQWVSLLKLAHPRFFHRLIPGGQHTLIALGGESRKGGKTPAEIIHLPAGGEPQTPKHDEKAAANSLEPSPPPTWPKNVPSGESDWPGYQGPRGNSTTPEVGWNTSWPAQGPAIAWEAKVGAGLGSFAVIGKRVYTSGNDGEDHENLVCLDLDSGKQLWRYQIAVPTKAHEMPIVPYGPASTPTATKEHVWFITREGNLLCLSAQEGSLLWNKHFTTDLGGKRPVYGYSSSPLLHQGRLYLDIGGETKSTTCLDAISGAIIWQSGKGEAGYSTPQIFSREGKDTLVSFKGQALELRAASDGRLIAHHETTTRDFCNCATPVVVGDKIFISHTGSMGSRVLNWNSHDSLTERWTDKKIGLLFHSGLPWQQSLLVFNDQLRGSDQMLLIDLSNGKPRWETNQVAKGTGCLCDDGHVIILSNTGELILGKLEVDRFDILSRVQALKPKTWCQPVISHRHLLIRNNAGEVICYQL